MKPLSTIPPSVRSSIKGVFTDIDDTLTTDGRLTGNAYSAMESLTKNGIKVVPITGRPAGWCDHIARMWPVDGVVGENGAFYFSYDRGTRKMHRRYVDPDTVREDNRKRLAELALEILSKVPGAAISADQQYRETDLAIDFCEDVPPLAQEDIDRIVSLFEEAGATAKVSSIHVNGWFGHYDKLGMSKLFCEDCLGIDLDQQQQHFIFVGDSPNDAPMFDYFNNSVGVANVRDFEDRLSHPPAYITSGRGGEGFAELTSFLLTEVS